ncbi:MAG: alpha-amylase family glycosyl hydrolase [Bacteroidia bacterium]
MKKILCIIIFTFYCLLTFAQPNGYAHNNDTTTFIFNEKDYNVVVKNKVVVTGAFRNWSQDMADTKWIMRRQVGNIWTLKVYNPNFEIIKPSMPFKFRIDAGQWLDPAPNATNIEGGNLIFMKGVEPLGVKATLIDNNQIYVRLAGLPQGASYTEADLLLTNALGEKIAIKNISYNLEDGTFDTISHRIKFNDKGIVSFNLNTISGVDKRRVYYLEIPKFKLKTLVTYDGWFKTLKSNKELGANISDDGKQTTFRVFAPRATMVKLYLYKPKFGSESLYEKTPYTTIDMKVDEQGVWETTLNENLEGTWYDYTVHGFTDPGNSFFETNPVHISDPYARVSDDSFGACMVAAKTHPASPLKNGRPKMEEVIAYEVHVQDFTDLLPLDENTKGTIAGMGVSGLTNSKGYPIGFDHLVNLGINTVHLMPVQEMLHWPKDEWKKAFSKDKYMIEQGIATENYDWGYRTSHSFAIESRYRQKGNEPGDERKQFRDVVQKFHDKNIAVIVDFVFNHTAENMDGRNYLFHFNAFDKQYYYRTKNLEHIGEYGNETKSENRYMVQRWIIDQCKHFIEEFGVDGFRIDLAGQTDRETLLALKAALPSDIIIYGEPWIDSNDPEYNKNPNWHWYKDSAPICYFNDDTRNAYKGPVFELTDKLKHRGWAGGNLDERDNVIKALSCSFAPQKNINSGINYLDIHDNYALADQFATTDFDGRFGVDEANYKIAATLLFTTPGPIVLHGGSEFMRSKGLAPLMEIVKEIPSGKLYFHGKRDTYNVRKANQFIWENIGKTKSPQTDKVPMEPYTNSNFKNMHAYWQGLMSLRTQILQPLINAEPSLTSILPDNKKPVLEKNFVQFIVPENKAMLGYMIDNKILVLINNDNKPNSFDTNKMNLKGRWKLIGNSNEINLNGITQKTLIGNPIKANGICIWLKE